MKYVVLNHYMISLLAGLMFSYAHSKTIDTHNINNNIVSESNDSSNKKENKSTNKPEQVLEIKTTDIIEENTNKIGAQVVDTFGGTLKEIEIKAINLIKLNSRAKNIFISDPAIADIQMINEKSLYLIGLKPGNTSLIINDAKGRLMLNYHIRVTYPLTLMKEAVAKLAPDHDITIMSIDDSVIVKGHVSSPEMAADILEILGKFIESNKLINKLTVDTSTQVLLKVKIAEVSRNITKSLGINWRAVSSVGNGMMFGLASGKSTSSFGESEDSGSSGSNTGGSNNTGDSTATAGGAAVKGAADLIQDLIKTDGPLEKTPDGGKWMIYKAAPDLFTGLIDALASESFASVLAEPTLVALSGKKATFMSGGEKGYTVIQPGGGNSSTTEFKQWGTSIEFTPVVISENRITITVNPKVSTLDKGKEGSIPALTSKEATTTVELGSGQSLAIAGLLQKNKNSTAVETPFLADIPFFGAAFRSSGVEVDERELVIIITPYIIKPSSKQLKTPVDMVPRMYTPFESLIKRKFHAKSGNNKGYNMNNGFSIK